MKQTIIHSAKNGFGCILLTAGLFLCQAQALYRWLPDSLGVVSQLLGSISYWLILPGCYICAPFFPYIEHHFPIEIIITGSLLAAIFYTILISSYQLWVKPKLAMFLIPRPRTSQWLKGTIITLMILGGGIFLYISVIEPNRLVIKEYTINISDLPKQWNGLKIVHLTDTHYGSFNNPSHLKRAMRLSNELQPDLIVLTGDYTLNTPDSTRPGIELFKDLKSTYGTVAILGNHDHCEGTKERKDIFQEIAIPLIDNTRLFLNKENGLSKSKQSETDLCVAGVGDLWSDECSLVKALQEVPDSMPRILLSHNPDFAEKIEAGQRIDLMLAGHTHGGQVYIPGFPRVAPSNYGEKYIHGYVEGPQCPVIISSGVGMSVIPFRFMVPPEIVVITLRRK